MLVNQVLLTLSPIVSLDNNGGSLSLLETAVAMAHLPCVPVGHSLSFATPFVRFSGAHKSTVNVKFLVDGSSSLIQ